MRSLLLGLALAAALSACASSHPTPAATPAAPQATTAGATATTGVKARPNRNVLLGEDLVPAGSTVGDAIQRLRPELLTPRRVSDRGEMVGPSLVLDDAGRSMEALWAMSSDRVAFVRYFPATEAQARFGTSGPVLYVVTKEHKPAIPLPR
jgi:hypothetical protein